MAETAAHLCDHVLPEVPVRQWVLSLPHPIRFLMVRDPDLLRLVRGIFVRAVQSFYTRRTRDGGHDDGRTGAGQRQAVRGRVWFWSHSGKIEAGKDLHFDVTLDGQATPEGTGNRRSGREPAHIPGDA